MNDERKKINELQGAMQGIIDSRRRREIPTEGLTEYFTDETYENARKKRKKLLTIYLIVLGVYVLSIVGFFVWYRLLPYKSPKIATIKLIAYPLTGLFVIFSFIYLGLPYGMCNKYRKLALNMKSGAKDVSDGTFIETDEGMTIKDGVEMKSLVFLEWNEFKKEFYERKVLVFRDDEFPPFARGDEVEFVTQGNVLVSYKITGHTDIDDEAETESESE